jgi:hypothetical protein
MNKDPSIEKQLNQFPKPPPGPLYAPGLPSNGWLISPYENQILKKEVVPRNLQRPPTIFNRSQNLEVPRQINNPYDN